MRTGGHGGIWRAALNISVEGEPSQLQTRYFRWVPGIVPELVDDPSEVR